MKKSILGVVVLSLAISACTTQKLTSSLDNDDVYASSAIPGKATQYSTQTSYTGEQAITSPDSATWAKSSASAFSDDYNDYSYSSRINRFSSSDTTKGYFDESYTGVANDVASENENPSVNLYFGVGAGYGGFYGSSYSYGFGWGYPYYGWGFDWGWGYPYYSWNYPWYSPWYYPYGCCCCYNPWYYEGYYPYYPTNTYYGPRNSLSSYDGTSIRNDRVSSQNMAGPTTLNPRSSAPPANSRITGTTVENRSSAQLTERTTDQKALRETGQTTVRSDNQTAIRSTPANQKEYRYSRSTSSQQVSHSKPDSKKQVQTRSQQPAPRYIRPGSANPTQRSGSTQSYSSPVYRQPKSSKEYISPRTNTGTSRTAPSSVGQKTSTAPATTVNRSRTLPSSSSKKNYSTPTRSYSPGSSAPARSGSYYSPPARSGSSGSYSAPSRSGSSGGSYSAPSRSGSSGGSTGGGGGRRR